jgi:hypothetical protein
LCNIKLLAVAKSEYLNNDNISILLSNFIKGVNQLNLTGLDVLNKENLDVNIYLNDNNNIEPIIITHAEV